MPHVAGAGEVLFFFVSSLFSLKGRKERGSGMYDAWCMVRDGEMERWRDGCLIEGRGKGEMDG